MIIILSPHYSYNDTSSIKRAFNNSHPVNKKTFAFYPGIIIIFASYDNEKSN
jgi:hypothetical protein